MINKTVKAIATVLLVAASALWAPAQEEPERPKKPATKMEKAAKEARAKAAEKKRQAKAKADTEAKAKALDLNRASKEELKKLPGVTDTMADAIIAKRPLHSKLDLVTKGIVPAGLYEGLKTKVAAK